MFSRLVLHAGTISQNSVLLHHLSYNLLTILVSCGYCKKMSFAKLVVWNETCSKTSRLFVYRRTAWNGCNRKLPSEFTRHYLQ